MTDRGVGLALGALAGAGVAIAGYLTWVHYSGAEPLCPVGGGCEKVQGSRYSELAGVPVAVIGLAGYLAILASLALGARLVTAFMAFAGFAFSAYLTYVELFTIEAVCQWCVASAVVMTLIAVLASVRVWRGPPTQAVAD